MATKTVNRQTFSVDYDLDDLNQGMFSMTEFKGICDRENDVTVDQSTFSKAENVYVNDNSVLASRAPFKFADGEAHIVNELYFGVYGLRVYKQVSDSTYTFTITCFTHETYTNDTDKFSTYQFVYSGTDDITLDVPKVTGIQIEDKVFIWFAGQGIIVFNTAGYYDEASSKNLPFFEDAYKYLYIPAHTLVTNGFESELEAQNFLTDSYIKRYLYTTESSVDWTELDGKILTIKQLNDDGTEKILYNITGAADTQDKIVYPVISTGTIDDYAIDTKVVNDIPIVVRTNLTNGGIQVAYGTSVFYNLPDLPDRFDTSVTAELTDDGTHVVIFTKRGIAFCQILSINADTSQIGFTDNFVWELVLYRDNSPAWSSTKEFVLNTRPWGRFHSRTEFVYIFIAYDSNGNYPTIHGHFDIDGTNYPTWIDNLIASGAAIPTLDGTEKIQIEFYVPQADDRPNTEGIMSGVNMIDMGPFIVLSTQETSNADVYLYQLWKGTITVPDEGDGHEETYMKVQSSLHRTVFTPGIPVHYEAADIKIYATSIQSPSTASSDWNYDVSVAYTTSSVDSIALHTFSVNNGTTKQTITETGTRWLQQLSSASDRLIFSKNGNRLLSSNYLYSDLPDYMAVTENWVLAEHQTVLPISEWYPQYVTDTNIYGIYENQLWTTDLQSGIIIEIDTYENVTFDDDGNMTINFRPDVPDCFSALGDYYISFATIEDGQFRLLMSDARRDEDTNDFLLYLPDDSEQKFSQRITNLHPLADDTMGIFTEDEIWYIQALNLDNESVTRYTKAVKSKLPVGCRQGNDVITADNGQAILFAVPRGIVYLTPQDFVSTTDRQINYISDAIQNIYNSYYFDSVKNSNAHEYKITIPSQIKIMTYSYWICFYRYMDNQILLIDTRSNSWWKWKTPYPILKLNNNGNLTVLMQIEKSKDAEDYSASLGGISYLYCNLSYYLYQDDVLQDYIDGTYVIQTSVYGERIEYQYASPVINWTFTTQKLHFGAINNYKYIRAININTNGEGKLVAKYTTKAYRDLYHPEASVTREIKINDLRTYVNRCNLLHVVNFALSLSSEDVLMVEPLSLNSISVKYEIKGQVR